MKSTAALTDFYYTELYDSLQALETERNSVRKKVLTLFFIVGTVSLIFAGILYNNCHCFNESFIWIGVGATAVGGFGYRMLIGGYRSDFKEQIIRPLIEAIETGLHYAPHAMHRPLPGQ